MFHPAKITLLHSECYQSLTPIDDDDSDNLNEFIDEQKLREFFTSVIFKGATLHEGYFAGKIPPFDQAKALQYMAVAYDTSDPTGEFKKQMVVTPSSWILNFLLQFRQKFGKGAPNPVPLSVNVAAEFKPLDLECGQPDGMNYFTSATDDLDCYMEFETGKIVRVSASVAASRKIPTRTTRANPNKGKKLHIFERSFYRLPVRHSFLDEYTHRGTLQVICQFLDFFRQVKSVQLGPCSIGELGRHPKFYIRNCTALAAPKSDITEYTLQRWTTNQPKVAKWVSQLQPISKK